MCSATLPNGTLPTTRSNVPSASAVASNPSALIDASGRQAQAVPKASRKVWFGGWVETPVYWRDHLPIDLALTGPAIIEQMDTTIIIDPGCSVVSDSDGNLIVTVPHANQA